MNRVFFNMKITLYTVYSDTYVQKHKYINICDTKINIFFCSFQSLMHPSCWLSFRPRGTLHLGGCSLPVLLYRGIVALWPSMMMW